MIIERVGLDAATPSMQVVEAQEILRPFCRFHAGADRSPELLRDDAEKARLPRASAGEFGEGHAQLAGLLAFGVTARKVSPFRLAADLQLESLLSICDLAGFTRALGVVQLRFARATDAAAA